MKVKSETEVAQLCPTLSDPTEGSPPGSSLHGIFQARAKPQLLLHQSIVKENGKERGRTILEKL